MGLLYWDIYEISTVTSSINGVMMRGRLRKLALENDLNFLTENTEDVKGGVRFAVLQGTDAILFIKYLNSIMPDVTINLVREKVANPVLSKLKVNLVERYTL